MQRETDQPANHDEDDDNDDASPQHHNNSGTIMRQSSISHEGQALVVVDASQNQPGIRSDIDSSVAVPHFGSDTPTPRPEVPFLPGEVESMLKSISTVKPMNDDEWNGVVALHSQRFPNTNRDAESLRQKFIALHKNCKNVTKTGLHTYEGRLARRIFRRMKQRAKEAREVQEQQQLQQIQQQQAAQNNPGIWMQILQMQRELPLGNIELLQAMTLQEKQNMMCKMAVINMMMVMYMANSETQHR